MHAQASENVFVSAFRIQFKVALEEPRIEPFRAIQPYAAYHFPVEQVEDGQNC